MLDVCRGDSVFAINGSGPFWHQSKTSRIIETIDGLGHTQQRRTYGRMEKIDLMMILSNSGQRFGLCRSRRGWRFESTRWAHSRWEGHMRPIGNLPLGWGNRERYKAYKTRYWRSIALDLVRSQME